eukprot:3511868-Rhodomonas_salina.2
MQAGSATKQRDREEQGEEGEEGMRGVAEALPRLRDYELRAVPRSATECENSCVPRWGPREGGEREG